MGWAEQHPTGAGTTQQVADAHAALDAVGVAAGPLAVRTLAAVGMLDRLRIELRAALNDCELRA